VYLHSTASIQYASSDSLFVVQLTPAPPKILTPLFAFDSPQVSRERMPLRCDRPVEHREILGIQLDFVNLGDVPRIAPRRPSAPVLFDGQDCGFQLFQ